MGSELAKRTCVSEGQHCSLWKIFTRLWGPNRSWKTWLKDQGNETLIGFEVGIILRFKFYLKELKGRVQKPWDLTGKNEKKKIKKNIYIH